MWIFVIYTKLLWLLNPKPLTLKQIGMEGFITFSPHSITHVFSPVYSASSMCQILCETLFFKIPGFVIQEAQVYFGQGILNSLHLLCQKVQHPGKDEQAQISPRTCWCQTWHFRCSNFSKLTQWILWRAFTVVICQASDFFPFIFFQDLFAYNYIVQCV